MRAKVQCFKTLTVADLRSNTRAVLPCGCAIFVGISSEGKVATAALPCGAQHEPITDRSSGLLRERLGAPSRKRLLVDACAEVLSQAAREAGL